MRPGCSDVRDVSLSRLLAVMSSRQPHGRFLAREDTGWTALDNTTGDAWTEHFQHRRSALRWLSRFPASHWGIPL